MNGGLSCDGATFEMKVCKAKQCKTVNMKNTKNGQETVPHQTKKLTPYITIPLEIAEDRVPKKDEEIDSYDYDLSKYEYSESRPIDYVPPPGKTQKSFSDVEDVPQKVTIRVENFIPITKDITQVCFWLFILYWCFILNF